MKKIWIAIDNMEWDIKTKYQAALLCFSMIFAIIGLMAGLLLKNWLTSDIWMIGFIGYPVIFAWIYVFLCSRKHFFHE